MAALPHWGFSPVSGDTRADWSGAFALVPSLDVAYVWHAGTRCAECHADQVKQFKGGKHAAAWAAMKAMPTIHWQPMAMIDGQRTIRDMAALMEQQQLMPRAEAEEAIRGFLTRMLEDAQQRSRF